MTLPMSDSEVPALRALPLFSDMADAHFETLFRGGYIQNFPPQIELITEGDPSDFLHVLLSGTVELFASWNNRDTTMAIVRPIATFIVAATIKDAPYLMSARTLEKSRIVLLPSSDVRRIFSEDRAFALSVVTELARCYRAVVKNTKDLKLRTSIERLANYLLRLQKEAGGAAEFELGVEKRRLASKLGMTPENLSRAIKSLQPYGVAINGNAVALSNRAELVRLAKPTPLIDEPSF